MKMVVLYRIQQKQILIGQQELVKYFINLIKESIKIQKDNYKSNIDDANYAKYIRTCNRMYKQLYLKPMPSEYDYDIDQNIEKEYYFRRNYNRKYIKEIYETVFGH